MNKLKKILILLPILATTLFIKDVKADDEKCYQVVYTSPETFNYVSRTGNLSTSSSSPSRYLGIDNYVSILPNTNYKISFTNDYAKGSYYANLWLSYQDNSGTFISRDNVGSVREFTSLPNSYYLFAYLNNNSNNFTWTDSQILGGQVILEQEVSCPPPENFNRLYVPDYNDNMCVEVIDKDTIRVFEDNETLNYTDYYVNSHYLSKTGSVDSEYIKNCTSLEKSSSFIYRNDIPEILFVSLLACVFTYLSMYLLFRVFRKRSR